MDISASLNGQSVLPTGLMSSKNSSVPLLARVYLTLGNWQWLLSSGLDDESVKGKSNAIFLFIELTYL